MNRIKWAGSIVLGLILAACSGGGSDSPNVLSNNGVNSAAIDPSGCAELISSGQFSEPLRLVNHTTDCDYLIDGSVRATNVVSIEPGTHIRMAAGATVTIDGGQLIAVGTASQRIRISGVLPEPGYWRSIYIDNARDSRIEFVDIADGGSTITGRLRFASLRINETAFSMIESTVSNSSTTGLEVAGIYEVPEFLAFSNNRFFANQDFGVEIEGRAIPYLDRDSDYHGGSQVNGKPYIRTELQYGNAVWRTPENPVMKKLNAPYWVDEITLEQDGKLDIEAGVELAMKPDFGKISLSGNARLRALGDDSRITIRTGYERSAVTHWNGIDIRGDARLELNGVDLAEGPIQLNNNASVLLNNTRLSGMPNYGIECPSFGGKTWQIDIMGDVSFNGQPGVGASPDCER